MEQKEQSSMEEKQTGRKRILIFLAVTFAVTYFIEIVMIAPLAGSSDVNEAMAAQRLLSGVMFVPALGAVLARILTKEGFMGTNLYFTINLKENLRYYGLVWLGFGILIIAGEIGRAHV